MNRSYGDLVASSLAAVACAVAAQTGLIHSYGIGVLGALLALALPGYALSAALFPSAVGSANLILGTVGLSLITDVIGGLLLHLVSWSMQPTSWSLLLAGITVTGSLLAAFRRHKGWGGHTPVRPRISWISAACFIVALSLVVFTVRTARAKVSIEAEPFTQLWVVPAGSPEVKKLEVGLHSQENNFTRYRILVERDGANIAEWQDIKLARDGYWTSRVELPDPPGDLVRVLLYRAEALDEIYRYVHLAPSTLALWNGTQKIGR